ncbi:MAG: SCO family protein [Bacteroidales bacterium]|nr:SCO family protein [Bacteroidales bacterium]
MKHLLLPLAILSSMTFSHSQKAAEDQIEIGVYEKLGETIPLDLTFINEKEEEVTLGSLIDKPTVLSFVYFDCPGMCSPLLDGISDVVSKMDMELGKDYQVITISFNTKDTPEKARTKKLNFVQNISQDHREHWIYLTGEEENIKAITNAVGFKYKPMGFDFAHPSIITVLSPEGKITRYLYGIKFLPFDLKLAVIEAQKGQAMPTINRVIDFCFAYDPAEKSYGLQVTKVVGILTLFILLIVFLALLIKGRSKTSNAAKNE